MAIVAIAIALRFVFHTWLGRSGFFLYWVAALWAAWIGGLGVAIVSHTLILFAEATWFPQPGKSAFPSSLVDVMILATYYGIGCAIGRLSDLNRAAQRRARLEHEEAVRQREQLRAALSCMADGVLMTNSNGRITLMNRAAEALTGWTVAEAGDKPP